MTAEGVDEPAPAPDLDARNRITEELEATLFVDAGAGSGKTTALVNRVIAIVASGRVELESIAAITFTEKAAAQLRDRIRRELERKAEGADDGVEEERFHRALDQLDGAAIGTLHSFAQRLLSENPIEAGLPPRVEVLDEVSSQVAFEHRWAMFRDEILADQQFARPLLLLIASGIKFEALRSLAVAFNDNWDLVEERVPEQASALPDVRELIRPVLADLDDVCATPCKDPDDNLRKRLDEVAEYGSLLRALSDSG
ncbi:MAG TPA: UvrD-helicase domain-containing protein, partial [Acidimicrobiales bacterium]|nr:UvrD-helicase domain-containing protein [Acidimicrobiales bacterium]